MPTSEARIQANRKNSALSTGPKTVEGKERSRRNGLKHGLTGVGVVVVEADAAEIELRNEELQAELAPKSRLGQIMVLKMATMSVRMERAAKRESAAIATRVRHAREDFDQERIDQAERLLAALGEGPHVNLRKLRKSPEGVDALIEAWRELRDVLAGPSQPTWAAWHLERAENLTGRRVGDFGPSRIADLSRATWGDFSGLGDGEGAGLEDDRRRAWARGQLVGRIDEELAKLEAHYETLDFETIELDRAQAPDRALFDPSREATLARRYESEATRGFFKALKELRQAEAEAAERPEPVATPNPRADYAPLGSSRDRSDLAPRDPRPTPGPSRPMDDEVDFGTVGRPGSQGRTALGRLEG